MLIIFILIKLTSKKSKIMKPVKDVTDKDWMEGLWVDFVHPSQSISFHLFGKDEKSQTRIGFFQRNILR